MDVDIVGLFVPIILFISIAVVLIFFIRARLSERKAIIEKGMSGEDLKIFLNQRKWKISPYTTAKLAVIAMGIGLALLIGSFIDSPIQEQLTLGLALLFPGIGLFFLYMHMIKNKKENFEG